MAAFHSMLHRLVSTPLEDTEYRNELKYIIDTAIINGYDERSIKILHKKHETRNNYTTLEQIQPENDKKYFEMTHSGTKTNFQNKKTVAYEKSQLLIFIKITIIFGLENSNSS
jgi:hypothetical protein